MDNVKTVADMYQAFGRGDVAAILEHMADDVEWEYDAPATEVPWLQARRGRDGVMQFFQAVGGGLEFHKFVPHTLLAGKQLVVALVDIEATVRATGKRLRETDEVHLWHFDERGRVKRFRHKVDTHAHVQATAT